MFERRGHFWSLYTGARVSASINSVLGANRRAETQLQQQSHFFEWKAGFKSWLTHSVSLCVAPSLTLIELQPLHFS